MKFKVLHLEHFVLILLISYCAIPLLGDIAELKPFFKIIFTTPLSCDIRHIPAFDFNNPFLSYLIFLLVLTVLLLDFFNLKTIQYHVITTSFKSVERPKENFTQSGGFFKFATENGSSASSALNCPEKSKILVVEDHAKMRAFISLILEDTYSIVTAKNGKEGISKALEVKPDLIVSDLRMPVIDGLKLCKVLKSDPQTNHIPIILLTANTEEEIELEGLESGANDYVTKPFNINILKKRISNLLETKPHSNNISETNESETYGNTPTEEEMFIDKINYIGQHQVFTPGFNSIQFAKELSISRMQLHRKMLGCLGFSVSSFIRKQRLKKAIYLLENKPSLTINEVAYEVGFNTPSYFIKCFKKEYNTTPSNYLNQ